jgi:heavy metal sensor kinase
MKIFNSIKWRLQIWYGLILVAVLAGFGFTAYQLEYVQRMRLIDGALQRRFDIVARALHRLPPRENSEFRNRPPPDQRPGEPFPEQIRPPEFQLQPQDTGVFGTNDTNYYFAIQTRDGRELARSSSIPAQLDVSGEFSEWRSYRTDNSKSFPTRIIKGNLREVFGVLPPGETILVGCSIASELRELKSTAWKLAGAGGVILFFGLAVGNWFVSRATRPIEQISSTAVKISAGDLSQRINVAETESELGKLAAVLNSTFARLESAFSQQRQFASDAAHELRTPVTVILTQTQTALHRERDAASYKETLEACQRAAQRMKKLISSLLELARLDAGQERLKRRQFDLAQSIHDCVEMIRPIVEERGLKLVSGLSPVEISGDSGRLSQVVTNLLTNAIQYNKPHGEVRVKLESQNGLAILTVSDTGMGISQMDLPNVFKRFYRGDKSRTGAANAGLGLAICKAIVEAHGGTIEAASEEEVGTTFTVRLPAS